MTEPDAAATGSGGQWDAIVVGAGPAGMAAATLLAGSRLRVVLIDEQPGPGGQIYRGIEGARPDSRRAEVLGADYLHGAELARRFRASGAAYWPQTLMWHAAPGIEVRASRGGRTCRLAAPAVVLATGAMERPVPVPGWTLPGVMTAGALQILLKSGSLVAAEPLVIAGTGPLFYLLAHQCIAAGAPVAALLDTAEPRHALQALRWLPRALAGEGPGYLRKGLKLMLSLRRAGVPSYRGVRGIEILGGSAVESVRFRSGRRVLQVDAGLLALHEGVIPAQNVTRMLGCRHEWSPRQAAFRPAADCWGATSVGGIWVAGDAGGISGARAAEHQGRLAALDVLRALGHIDMATRDRLARDDRRALLSHQRIRPLLDTLYSPRPEVGHPDGEVEVCRCENVTAAAIAGLAARGFGPNRIKAALRCGMGPCQGRLCGPVVARIVADAAGRAPSGGDYYSIRPPLAPMALGEIADPA